MTTILGIWYFWDGYNSIDDFVAKLGTTGDGTTRQLGFGAIIPVWVA